MVLHIGMRGKHGGIGPRGTQWHSDQSLRFPMDALDQTVLPRVQRFLKGVERVSLIPWWMKTPRVEELDDYIEELDEYVSKN